MNKCKRANDNSEFEPPKACIFITKCKQFPVNFERILEIGRNVLKI